ncbi:T9SS type B sorting domain-containing protein [Christiangramia echinicola]|uniref:T9SS type B sorting domain-containing protein n=1 Tax=Christiangramia echinicola TaxID=279359 RepID=UPI000424954A|nr:T9SS type B sorting domain-containing protein [Christiangramia echinicola]
MKYFFALIFFFLFSSIHAQLGFCEGSKGDPIFHEDFGQGSGTGSQLAPGITNYNFVRQDPHDGEYTISNTIGNQITSWHRDLPATNISGGKALIVNADFTAGRFYRKEVAGLCENTTYEFSAFLMNIYDRDSNVCEGGGIPNNVRFEIWDETDSFLIKEGDTPSIPSTSNPEWKQFALTFRSEPGQGAVILKMFNNGDGGCGNDLAIDDIIFRSCGDLTTISTEGNSGNIFKVCEENTPIRLELEANADSSVYDQQFYQWQISTNSENWDDIPGANTSTYQTSLIDESVYFRVKVAEDVINLTSNVCSSASEPFKVDIIKTPDAPQSNGDLTICQNDPAPVLRVTVASNETVNWYDEETGGNLLVENSSTYLPQVGGTYYAEAVNTDLNCNPGPRTSVTLTINRIPTLQDENLSICPDSNLNLSAGVDGYDYVWSSGETTETIAINSPGNYSVDVISEQACIATKKFTVSLVENAEIEEVVSNGSNVEIVARAEGVFQYSLDGINYQQSPIFFSVPGGIYLAYIKDSEDCKIDILEFAHVVIPEMITPNNDGYNDRFELKGIEFFESSEIQIFNRYGKLIKSGEGSSFNWEGRLNGMNLPADDYWYRIKIKGFNDKTGHFSLIR